MKPKNKDVAARGWRHSFGDYPMTRNTNLATRMFQWTPPVPAGRAPLVMLDAGEIGWGVLRRQLGDVKNDLRQYVWQKMTHGRGPGRHGEWRVDAPHAVFLPANASADLLNPRRLVEKYEDQSFDTMKDLACVVNIPIAASANTVLEWRRIRRFAEYQFLKRNMACIAILHRPADSGIKRDNHVHLIAPARELGGDGFGAFMRPFATDAGAADMWEAWSNWK
jgi:hypothetical protein